jgi:hypothetical protein
MGTELETQQTAGKQSEARPGEQYFNLPALESEILREIPAEWIDRLFARLWAWYGRLIEDRWGADTAMAKSIWRDDLEGLSAAELKGGMELCRDRCKFPPTLPEFRALCQESTGRVDARARWQSCQNGKYLSPAEYWAVQKYGYPEFRAEPWEKARYKWPGILKACMLDERAGKLSKVPDHVAGKIANG